MTLFSDENALRRIMIEVANCDLKENPKRLSAQIPKPCAKPVFAVESRIFIFRKQRVMLDIDLADSMAFLLSDSISKSLATGNAFLLISCFNSIQRNTKL
jgi:hypothetical protein